MRCKIILMGHQYVKLTDKDIKNRQSPPNRIVGDLRVIDYGQGNGYIVVPREWGYFQYLVLGFVPKVITNSPLNNPRAESMISSIYKKYVGRMTRGVKGNTTRLFNAEVYLLHLASDLELLVMKGKLTKDLIKRLNSSVDTAMRGAIYEVLVAATFLRCGYIIKWYETPNSPEFIATKGSFVFDIEAKRRDTSSNLTKDIDKEISGIKGLLKKALGKNISYPYLIFVDTDLPPAFSEKYSNVYTKISEMMDSLTFDRTSVTVTNNGYEYVSGEIQNGRNSAFTRMDNSAPSDYQLIISTMHAKLPPEFSLIWQP